MSVVEDHNKAAGLVKVLDLVFAPTNFRVRSKILKEKLIQV